MNKRIITLGDSTMQFNNFLKFPQTGWPQALERFVRPDVEILNFAVNGKSTKNFISLQLFDRALKNIRESDLVLIEFGHNDVKKEDLTRYTEPFGEYQQNLKYMVECCKRKGADVILLTSIVERYFDENGIIKDSLHLEYTKAMKALAEQMSIPCIDMYGLTKKRVGEEGEENSKRFYMNFPPGLYDSYPNGLEDNTHLRYEGAFMVAKCFYEEIINLGLYTDLFILRD